MSSTQTNSPQIKPRHTGFLTNLLRRNKDGLLGLWSYFVKTLILWLLLAGALAALLLVWKPGFLASDPFPKILELLATVLLSGGVFQALLKSMQYSQVFKSELLQMFDDDDFVKSQQALVYKTLSSPESAKVFCNALTDSAVLGKQKASISEAFDEIGIVNQKDMLFNLMYSPEVLKNRKDLEDIWKSVSRLVYRNNFPEISELIAGRVLREYFPKNDNFYYDTFVEDMRISATADPNHFEVRSTLNFTIKAMDSSQEVGWNYSNEIKKEPKDELTSFVLEDLQVDNKSQLAKIPAPYKIENHEKGVRLEVSLKLSSAKEYKVRLVEKKVYDPAIDDIKDFTSARFINNLTLHVDYPGDRLEVVYSPVGTGPVGALEKGENKLTYSYNDLIFPNQGYRLVLRKRGVNPDDDRTTKMVSK